MLWLLDCGLEGCSRFVRKKWSHGVIKPLVYPGLGPYVPCLDFVPLSVLQLHAVSPFGDSLFDAFFVGVSGWSGVRTI